MIQKETCGYCSIIGTILIVGSSLILSLSACKEEDKYYVETLVDLVYKNETSKFIECFAYGTVLNKPHETFKLRLLEIEPYSQTVRETAIGYDSRRGFDLIADRESAIAGFHRSMVLVMFDSTKCILYKKGEGPTAKNAQAYDAKRLGELEVQYTYTFTEADYEQAVDCDD